jgi:hypothetical protein
VQDISLLASDAFDMAMGPMINQADMSKVRLVLSLFLPPFLSVVPFCPRRRAVAPLSLPAAPSPPQSNTNRTNKQQTQQHKPNHNNKTQHNKTQQKQKQHSIQQQQTVLGIILGGGAGTRLYPLTKQRAKPAVPLGANYRLIDIPVSNCVNSNVTKIYCLTQFNSASLNRHLSLAYNSNVSSVSRGFVEVLAASQSAASKQWFQGTADAVRQYMWLFDEAVRDGVQDFLVLSGESFFLFVVLFFVWPPFFVRCRRRLSFPRSQKPCVLFPPPPKQTPKTRPTQATTSTAWTTAPSSRSTATRAPPSPSPPCPAPRRRPRRLA